MAKLGKKVVESKGTLMAYACYCGTCPCATSKCNCKSIGAASHRSSLTNSSSTSFNMQYTALEI